MTHKADVLEFARLTKNVGQPEIERIINKYLAMDRLQVQAAISRPETPMLEILLASVVAQAAQKGDPIRAEWLLAQLRRSTLRSKNDEEFD